MDIKNKCVELGISFPEPNSPAGQYVPVVRDGDIVYTSGQTAKRSGTLVYSGKLGAGVSPEQGYVAAKLCALNCLAKLDAT